MCFLHRNIRCHLYNLLLLFKVYMYIYIILSSKSTFIQFFFEPLPPPHLSPPSLRCSSLVIAIVVLAILLFLFSHLTLFLFSPFVICLHHAQTQKIPQVIRHLLPQP